MKSRNNPEPLLESLREDLQIRRPAIRSRLDEFGEAFREGDERIFRELCFCILAANSSAEMGIKSLAAIEDIVLAADLPALQDRLSRGHRYWRIRPAYIVHTREYLKREHGLRLRDLLASFPDPESRREFFVKSKDIRGIGMKEASHFLRNVGFTGYAILDKHILNSLADLGVIRRPSKPLNASRYRRIEKKMMEFAAGAGINPDELDLLLWSRKTGKILK
ncbi:MAG TPA: N-glycosylase [Nitrospiria bacterium]